MAFLKVLAQGFLRFVLKTGANVLTGGVPVVELCAEIWESYDRHGKGEKQARADVQQLAASPDALAQIQQVVRETAGDQPSDVQLALSLYLEQVPGTIRRSLRSAQDPSGHTLPAGLVLHQATDLARFVPDRVPRFRPGDHPVPGTDLVLERLLGTGGFGEVWKALHEDRPEYPAVALKFCTDANAVLSLRNEVRLLDRVATQVRTESGIVQLLHANLRTDPPYLEYEYVEGGDLGGLLLEYHRNGTATWVTVSRLMLRLASIVGVAHEKGIVHRDLKPDNILTRRSEIGPELKIADFGIGGISAGQDIKRWEKTRVSGVSDGLAGAFTPLYASPQQRSGNPADPRDDVYALGVLWYQALTGDLRREPPTGGGWKKRFVQQGIPLALVELLESCIDADPADRPANARVLTDRLTILLKPRTNPSSGSSALPRVLTDRLGALPEPPTPSVPFTQRVEKVPAAAGGREPPVSTRLKLVLLALGGNRDDDVITVFFDGRELGKGCAAAGFELDCVTRPGNHCAELHGYRKKRTPFPGKGKFYETQLVFPVHLPEPGAYTATFHFGRGVRLLLGTAPNVMHLTRAGPTGQITEIARKKLIPLGFIVPLLVLCLLFLFFVGGMVALIVGIRAHNSRSSTGASHWEGRPMSTIALSFQPSSLSLQTGQETKVRLLLRANIAPFPPWKVNVRLEVPQDLQTSFTVYEVEIGKQQEEIEIPVKAVGKPGRFRIIARLRGWEDSYPADCMVDVTKGKK